MDSTEELTLADLNLAEAAREMVRWHLDYRIDEREDLLLLAGSDSFPIGYSNCAMAIGPRVVANPERMIAAADEFFAGIGRGYTFWIRQHLDAPLEQRLQEVGQTPFSDSPGMLLDTPNPDRPLGAGLRVAQAVDLESASQLAAIEAGGYATMGMPPEFTLQIFSMPERLLNPHTIVVLGYAEGQPMAAAIAILSNGIAGIYWVATLPEARGRGLGEACTRLAGNRALEMGARCVVLQASTQGEPIYRRMGYREITRYRWYAKGPPSAD